MDLVEYRREYKPRDGSPGWAAIDMVLGQLYPLTQPKHYAPTPHYALGGDDPLDGISIYQSGLGGEWHYHYITYGFSSLYYDEASLGGEYSGYGFELTFRLKPFKDDCEYPGWPLAMLQNLARYVFKTGKCFDNHHYLDARGPLRLDTLTELSGLLFVTDPELGTTATPHGEVQFLQAIGITAAELSALRTGGLQSKDLAEALKAVDPFLVTDLTRS